MESKKLSQVIDSNNNETTASHTTSKSSLLSIGKKCAPTVNAVSSTSTVSSVSMSSLNDSNNNNVKTSADKNAIKRNSKILNEKENKIHHFMTSSVLANTKPQLALTTPENHANSEQNSDSRKPAKYGELVILGYNGCIAQATKPDNILNFHKTGSIYSKRRKSKFILQAKDKPSGVKPSTQFNCHNKQDLDNVISKNTENHSVTYTLSRTHQVIVQYVPDETTDMFQIGRSTESAIDFIVLDTQVPQLSSAARGMKEEHVSLAKTAVITGENSGKPSGTGAAGQSTISRYSCRISVERQYPYTARIYAAGFDSSKRIFLGEKATKWKNEKGEFDGVTTNGVLIMHPPEGFLYGADVPVVNEWMEVSVGGAVFNLDENRLAPCLNKKASSGASGQSDVTNRKSNILRDGTLIDLCGATLLWRSIDSLEHTPTKQYLEMNLNHLNQLRPQCPVGFKTLVFPSSASPSSTSHLPSSFLSNNILLNNNNDLLGRFKFPYPNRLIKANGANKHADRIPMVYLKCGHIHGMHDWGVKKDNERECPLCRKVGPYVQLLVGIEPSFYCDTNFQASDSNNYTPFKPYAFLPCGHMASESTCRYWAQVKIPQGITQGLSSLCPFCAAPLCKDQPIVKLILQEGL